MGNVALLLAGISAILVIRTESKRVDLSYLYNEKTVYWPGSRTFQLSVQTGNERGYWYSIGEFCTSEHGGTHMDAPYHFAEDKWKIGDIPLDNLFAPGVVIDGRKKATSNRDALLTIADVQSWEEYHGRIPERSVVLARFGWGKLWPNRTEYLGIDDGKLLHFPGFDPDLCEWLVTSRNVVGLGIDTPSTDHGESLDFRCHRHVAKANVYNLENVANLDKLPETGFSVISLPINIAEGTGGPCRIVAVIDDKSAGDAAAVQQLCSMLLPILLILILKL